MQVVAATAIYTQKYKLRENSFEEFTIGNMLALFNLNICYGIKEMYAFQHVQELLFLLFVFGFFSAQSEDALIHHNQRFC